MYNEIYIIFEIYITCFVIIVILASLSIFTLWSSDDKQSSFLTELSSNWSKNSSFSILLIQSCMVSSCLLSKHLYILYGYCVETNHSCKGSFHIKWTPLWPAKSPILLKIGYVVLMTHKKNRKHDFWPPSGLYGHPKVLKLQSSKMAYQPYL